VGREALELVVEPHRRDLLAEGCEDLIKARHVLGDDLVIFSDHGRELAERITARASRLGFSIDYHRIRPANLEDVFLKLTGRPLDDDREEKETEGGC
jgi:lipooligosaccharide transport system ATP-binding protein